MVEYLDPEIANEGFHAEKYVPGAWTDAPDVANEEYQPDLDPPHIPDYSAFKKHKHYRQYFRPYRRQPFPAFVYHPIAGSKIVKTKEEVLALGSEWTPFVPVQYHITKGKRIIKSDDELSELGIGWRPATFDENSRRWVSNHDMTGKTLPAKNDTQRLTEALVENITKMAPTAQGAVDPHMIAAIVAATVAAINQQPAIAAKPIDKPVADELMPDVSSTVTAAPADVERAALIELAEREGVKIDNRWGNDRIKKALGLE